MKYYSEHTATKLIIILFLALVIIGIFMGTDIIISTMEAILNAIMPCVIVLAGLYILIHSLFR